MAQVWFAPALICVKVPGGGVLCPLTFHPPASNRAIDLDAAGVVAARGYLLKLPSGRRALAGKVAAPASNGAVLEHAARMVHGRAERAAQPMGQLGPHRRRLAPRWRTQLRRVVASSTLHRSRPSSRRVPVRAAIPKSSLSRRSVAVDVVAARCGRLKGSRHGAARAGVSRRSLPSELSVST